LSSGRIPFDFRIGITGHRELRDPEALAQAVQDALQRLRGLLPECGESDVALVAVSSLAEGADQLVARELLARPGSRLEAVLPFPPPEYARDFPDPESRKQDVKRTN